MSQPMEMQDTYVVHLPQSEVSRPRQETTITVWTRNLNLGVVIEVE